MDLSPNHSMPLCMPRILPVSLKHGDRRLGGPHLRSRSSRSGTSQGGWIWKHATRAGRAIRAELPCTSPTCWRLCSGPTAHHQQHHQRPSTFHLAAGCKTCGSVGTGGCKTWALTRTWLPHRSPASHPSLRPQRWPVDQHGEQSNEPHMTSFCGLSHLPRLRLNQLVCDTLPPGAQFRQEPNAPLSLASGRRPPCCWHKRGVAQVVIHHRV